MRRIFLAFVPLLLLAACGGSGSSDLSSGSGSSGGGGTTPTATNVAQISVDGGPAAAGGVVNIPFVTVVVCAPGSTTNCQTIDHVEVDTASYGLRIIASVMNSSLLAALPTELTASFNLPIVECTMFGDGYSWGPLRTADVQIAGEKAASVPMQVMGDPAFSNIPTDCSNTGTQEDTVQTFGANGILGVGPFAQDCGTTCVDSTTEPAVYYACATGGGACNPTQLPLAQQATNPVVLFTTDNNGTIVQLPAIADSGAATVTGSLIFGIGTQSNNGLGSATVLTTDNVSGFITTTYKGTNYTQSFLDSGSNLIFLNDSAITTCDLGDGSSEDSQNTTFFCPGSQLSLTATNVGQNGVSSNVTFKIGNAKTLFASTADFAFDNLGAPNFAGQTASVDFGLPFFFGRSVYTAIEGQNTSGGLGPYFAY